MNYRNILPLVSHTQAFSTDYWDDFGYWNDGTFWYEKTPTYTARVTAYATATGITDYTILDPLNIFDLGLTYYGLDTIMKAIYPMVTDKTSQSDMATQMKYNFMNPLDTNAAFRLNWVGGWVYSRTGALPNGTNAYADTNLSQNPVLNQNSWSMSIYLRTNLQGNTVFGVSQTGVQTALYPYQPSNTWAFDDFNSTGTLISDSTTNSLGFYQGIRQSSSVVKMIKNTAIASKTSNSSGRNTIPFYLGGVNFNSTAVGFSARQIAFSSIGDGLTDFQADIFSTLVNNLQKALNRAVY